MIKISHFLLKRLHLLKETEGEISPGEKISQERSMYASVETGDERMPMRRAALVWLGFALAGWVVVVVSAYTVMRFGDTVVAGIQQVFDPASLTAEEETLIDIAPAAGKNAD